MFYWNRIPTDFCERICSKFNSDIEEIKQTGKRLKNRKSNKLNRKRIVFTKFPKYPDTIDRIVYNRETMKKNIEKMKKAIIKENKKCLILFKKLKTKKIINKLHKLTKIYPKCYVNEVIQEETLTAKYEIDKNTKRIQYFQNIDVDSYFKSLNQANKEKLIDLYPKPEKIEEQETDDESIQNDEDVIDSIFKKVEEKHKKKAKIVIREKLLNLLNNKKQKFADNINIVKME